MPDRVPADPEVIAATPGGLETLRSAVDAWIQARNPARLHRWLDRELDEGGVPRRLPVAAWGPCLEILAAVRSGEVWGRWEDPGGRLEGFARAWLRFTRADGAPIFGPDEPAPGGRSRARAALALDPDPALARVLGWWFPGVADGTEPAAPPLPADARADRVLALLRPDWLRGGDLAAIDQRMPGGSALVELRGQGRRWLGPGWSTVEPAPSSAARGRPVCWSSSSQADVAEWSFRAGRATVTRTAVLLRGRRLALLAEQVDAAPGPAGWRVALPPGIAARPNPENRALTLVAPNGRSTAQAIPLSLPRSSAPADAGSLRVEDQAIFFFDNRPIRRRWLPLLISWEPVRNRKALSWRALTVAEKSRACPPDVAFAARVAWGSETVVVYRSLGRPGLRSFLGHQTRARLLVGGFDRDGEVTPWARIEG